MKSQFRKISIETVQNYLHYTLSALLINKIRRYDLKGRRILETHEKYYMSDVGLSSSVTGFTPSLLPGRLENIVLLELLMRGYQVSIGKLPGKEIDFIARKGSEKLYIQVCSSLNDSKVIDREYGALEIVNDHFPKYVLSLDTGFETSRNGILWKNIADFLLNEW